MFIIFSLLHIYTILACNKLYNYVLIYVSILREHDCFVLAYAHFIKVILY